MTPALGPPEPPLATAEHRGNIGWDDRQDGYSMLPFIVREPIEWRALDEEGWNELYLPGKDRWKRIQDHWLPVLEALGEGGTLPEAHVRAAEAMPHRPKGQIRYIVRKVTGELIKHGLAEVLIPEVPETFVGRYERTAELGRGGMGIVWRCQDLEDGSTVAVKQAWNWRGKLKSRDRSLREEGEAMAALDHPGIIAYKDAFEIDGRYHLVREYLEGPPLHRLDRTAPLTLDQRRRILTEITQGLIHLRDTGYLCLDIKTENYMLDGEDGPVKLVDLGLCRPLEDGKARVKGFPGTRSYQDPMLMKQDHATEATTVYALGKILWRLNTGRGPRPRANYESYFEQHETDQARLAKSDATEAEQVLFAAACDPTGEKRPRSLEAFLDAMP